MNKNIKFIFEMIASVTTESGIVPNEPENVDWEYIYSVTLKHNISNIIGYCVKQNNFNVPEGVKNAFIQKLYQLALVNESQISDTYAVFNAFEENNIDYMSLKGIDIKALYPSADMRVMGDADILIHTEEIEKIKSIMESLDFEFCVESNHEYVYRKEPITKIELHKFMIPSYNEDLYAYYGNGWKLAKPVKEGSHRYALSDEDTYIYLLAHFAKHYRDAGAGIKYVIDLWLYKKKYTELDIEYIENQLQKLRLLDFYKSVEKLTSCWFENGTEDDLVTNMTDFIVESGVHGSKQHRVLSETVREYMDKDIKKAEKYRYIKVAFPSLMKMTAIFPVLKKAPVLLPFCWILRLVNGIIFKRKNIAKNIERVNNIENEALENYKNHMASVGIDIYNERKEK